MQPGDHLHDLGCNRQYWLSLRSGTLLRRAGPIWGMVEQFMGNLDLAGAQVVEQFANNQKIDLGGGARFGGTVVDDKVHYLEASFVGRVWDIVSSPNKVSITNLGPTITLQDNVFSTVYGEAGFQLDWLNRYSGWSAYVRADGKFNNQFQTFTGKAGVRYAF